MVRKGGRTALRVSDDVFKTTPIGTDRGIDVGKSPLKNILCDAYCKVFCDYRDTVITELRKERPDLSDTGIGEALTDLKTASDLLGGGECDCKCKQI